MSFVVKWVGDGKKKKKKEQSVLFFASDFFFSCGFNHSPSLPCESVEETTILPEPQWLSEMVSTFIIRICVWRSLESNSPTLRHWDRSVGEVGHGLQPLLFFKCPVSFKAQLAACLQMIFLCIFCIVYYHFCQICFCIFWMSQEYLRLHSCNTCLLL